MDKNVEKENNKIISISFEFSIWRMAHNYFRFIHFYSEKINLSAQLEQFCLMIDSQIFLLSFWNEIILSDWIE